jgi:glutathione S-transferase
MTRLYIGNKNYSSWSMRPWVLMKQTGIAFEEVMVRFDAAGHRAGGSAFKRAILPLNPAGAVPVLEDGGLVVSDTLAICEYLAETRPEKNLWPAGRERRAQARAICAEMHAGFQALRGHCGMNIEADLRAQGPLILRDRRGVRADLDRIAQIWGSLLDAHGGPMLFGEFSIADAYYAPVCTRIRTYGLPVPAAIAAYADRVLALPGVKAWIDGALAEHDFLPLLEPYRLHR